MDLGVAVRQKPWCSGILPIVHSPPSRSPRCCDENISTSAVRLAPQCSSPNSKIALSRSAAVCTNVLPHIVRRRELLQLCFFSGVFIYELLQKNEAVALEGEDDMESPPSPSPSEVGLENGRLRSCEGSSPCVSTSAFRSPSRFMPPWQYLGQQKDAYGELLKALKRMGSEILKTEGGRYVYATVSTSSSKEDIDDLEFLFVDKVVCFRSFSRKTALDPPFCWWPGCINGPRNRRQMEALRDDLGWIPLETDEEKVESLGGGVKYSDHLVRRT